MATVAQIKLNIQHFERQKLSRVKTAIEQTMTLVANDAKKRVRVKTSALQRSIMPGPIKVTLESIEGEVNANQHYALYVEKGTRPHFPPWEPRSTLSFPAARAIAEKGTRDYPYLEPALKANERTLKRLVQRALS